MFWRTVTLRDVCEFRYGKALPAAIRTPGGVPVYGSNGKVGSHDTSITRGPAVIIGRKGSVGEVHYSPIPCWPIDTTYFVDRTATTADLRWLAYRLRGLGLTLMNKAAAVPGLNRDDAYRLGLVLPPIEEQQRIADILDRADALRAKRREALAHLDDLTRSIFLDMFGPSVAGSRRPLGDLVQLKSGAFLPASAMAAGGEFPVLGGNGINGHHDKYLFEEPRIVVGRVGAYCGCVHLSPPRSWVTDNALYVERKDEALQLKYLAAALRHANLNQYASQSGQPLISGSRIYPVEILVPPAPAQYTFSKRTRIIESAIQTQTASLHQLDALFKSLQQRAFAGLL